ncbi:NmrA family NAD(P)-binding protein [Chitinophaga sp. 22321]|uniref:NmrA family NAD(P)-binding protein n=1 Tax=Chitinophaga hostae TaxID=2831022 RepID=A0ABS5J3S7_9BACT|nr:NmrA family NAD(P)-binding protein [Chitinophaga hostae]MBS0029887.1 NmrA family NAD(P)-binding protein [Chitinophaga hostae]
MNIVLTGSLGHIGKPLTQELVKKGHSVTVISSNAERQKDIEALGAKAAIGTMQDAHFLSAAFRGADIVYLMETLDAVGGFFNKDLDFIGTITEIGYNYKQAIEASGVKQVVHLSSVGAHMDKGNGILAFHYNVEQILKQLPEDVSIKFIRPVGFYTNFFAFMRSIKGQGAIAENYGGDKKHPWVSPVDIATVIAEEISTPFEGRKIRYVASDEVSPNEIASLLGAAIGKPDLKWSVIPDDELLDNWLAIGMNAQVAQGFAEMQAAMHSGVLYEDFYRNKPVLGEVRFTEFVKEFAAVYHQQ